MDRYAVIGNPIKQSKSPLIHHLFAEQTNQDMSYEPILVDLDGLPAALSDFQLQGGRGVNITMPFKHRAFGLVDSVSERAQRAEAINTVKFNDDGTRFGDNTDGIGLVRDILFNYRHPIAEKRILVLGAGGAVRGILEPLLKQNPLELVIVNRTENKAQLLAKQFSDLGPIKAYELSALSGEVFDIVINATSASLQGEVLDLSKQELSEGALCYDMVYDKGVTPFLQWAQQHGAAVSCDGLGMLVEQAAESFYLWRNLRPDARVVLTLLKSVQTQFAT